MDTIGIMSMSGVRRMVFCMGTALSQLLRWDPPPVFTCSLRRGRSHPSLPRRLGFCAYAISLPVLPAADPCHFPGVRRLPCMPMSPTAANFLSAPSAVGAARSGGDQTGLYRPFPEATHAGTQELKHRPPLHGARRDHRPHPFAPPVPALAACPLRDVPIDHHEPNGLLR